METVLVTGAGGYIGSVLVSKLLENGFNVVAFDRYYFGQDKVEQNSRLRIVQDDTRHLSEKQFEGVDHVIDLAAISNDPCGDYFDAVTWQVNHLARAKNAQLAKKAGVKRYIFPSSCSVYGFQDQIVDETSKTNPLTTYAMANLKAEKEVLPLSSDDFIVTVIRQATVFGYSPRMRFDLAINGMTHGAWKDQHLPLMRDGTQYRPMVHIQDTTDLMLKLLDSEPAKINGEIFNVGGNELNYQIGDLGELVAKMVEKVLGKPVKIEWYGDPDHRSYQVDFSKVKNKLGWSPKWIASHGIEEILSELTKGTLEKTTQTITLSWYQELEKWNKIINQTRMYDGILNIDRDKED